MTQIDHLVIAAETLQQGVEYVYTTLGVAIPRGGVHRTMGTHNHLMQLGDNTYLEVISIDPGIAIPDRPRWFNLDDGLMRESLSKQPRLITWVVNTTNIEKLSQASAIPVGIPTDLHRDSLHWQIALTEDGRLLANGLFPYVIQWHSKPHPSQAMANLGCRLISLDIYHNKSDWMRSKLKSIGADHLVSTYALADSESAYLSARIDTPSGIKILTSQLKSTGNG